MNARPVILSLNMPFYAYDGNTLTPLANYLTVQSPFPHPDKRLCFVSLCDLQMPNVWGIANCWESQLWWQTREQNIWRKADTCGNTERKQKVSEWKGSQRREQEAFCFSPLSQRCSETIWFHSSDELLIKQTQTFFSFPHVLEKVLLLFPLPLGGKLTLTSILSMMLKLPSVSVLTLECQTHYSLSWSFMELIKRPA